MNEYTEDNICAKSFPHILPNGKNCPFTRFPFETKTKPRKFKIKHRNIRLLNQTDK